MGRHASLVFVRVAGIRVATRIPEVRTSHNFVCFNKPFVIGPTTFCVAECSCGNVCAVSLPHLRSEHSLSCGCLARRALGERARVHGMYGTPMHTKWRGMIQRCTDANDSHYQFYGARGVSVCRRWTESFLAFIADVGECPGVGYSLDRFPDNNGNYEPGNVRWATMTEQCNNRRTNVNVTLYGKTKTITEWSRVSLVPAEAIRRRLLRGWNEKRAVFFMDEKMTKRVTKGKTSNA